MPIPDGDVVERLKRAEDELQKCHQFAIASQYASALMHDFNNPLEAIANLVFLINMQADEPAKVREYADTIEQQVTVLGSIAGQVLSFHREQTSKVFDLVEIVDSTLRLYQTRISSGKVEVVRDYCAVAKASVLGAQILQVISNLILNALDALPESDAQLNISIRATEDDIQIDFVDNGIGFDEAGLEHLFEPYRTTKPKGTGLGLWMSKRIVDDHKGTLSVIRSQTKSPSGTTVRLTLPVKAAA